MSGPWLILAAFPNPVDWAIDKASDFVGGAASAGFGSLVGGLNAWVIDAAVWVVGSVFGFFATAADPNVQADWFVKGNGPYATTAAIGATLLVFFVFAGITQGVISGDVGGMLRRIAIDLPLSILGMVGLVTVTQALIRLTDVLAAHVLGSFKDQTTDFTKVVESLNRLNGGQATAFVVFLLGLLTVLAGIVLVAELVIRESLIYLVVALAPLVFATRLWPATQGAARKLLELLCALIVSKLVIAVALAVAAAAAVGTGSGGEVTSLPPPEVYAQNPGGSVTQAVGILLAAAAAFAVAAFSPLLIARLLPLTEGAVVAQGLRGAPVRAGHQGMMMANTAQMVSGRRLHQLAAGRTGGSSAAAGGGGPGAVGAGGSTGPAGAGGGAGAGGAGGAATGGGSAAAGGASAGAAAAGPAAVVVAAAVESAKVAKKAASAGARAATGTAEAATSQPGVQAPARPAPTADKPVPPGAPTDAPTARPALENRGPTKGDASAS